MKVKPTINPDFFDPIYNSLVKDLSVFMEFLSRCPEALTFPFEENGNTEKQCVLRARAGARRENTHL